MESDNRVPPELLEALNNDQVQITMDNGVATVSMDVDPNQPAAMTEIPNEMLEYVRAYQQSQDETLRQVQGLFPTEQAAERALGQAEAIVRDRGFATPRELDDIRSWIPNLIRRYDHPGFRVELREISTFDGLRGPHVSQIEIMVRDAGVSTRRNAFIRDLYREDGEPWPPPVVRLMIHIEDQIRSFMDSAQWPPRTITNALALIRDQNSGSEVMPFSYDRELNWVRGNTDGGTITLPDNVTPRWERMPPPIAPQRPPRFAVRRRDNDDAGEEFWEEDGVDEEQKPVDRNKLQAELKKLAPLF